MLLYALLEDAVIALAKQASDSNALGYKIAEVKSYGGEFDTETFFTQVRKWPAWWVTVGGSRPRRVSSRKYECDLRLVVMVGARNVRGERETRHGSVNEPGTYQMLQDVRVLLAGRTFGLDIGPLALGADRTLFNTRVGNEARSVLACEFSSKYVFTAPEIIDPAAADLNSIGLYHYLKPGDQLPDALDVVNKPQ